MNIAYDETTINKTAYSIVRTRGAIFMAEKAMPDPYNPN